MTTTTIDRAEVRRQLVAADKAETTAELDARVDAEVARLEAEAAEAARVARIAHLAAQLNNGALLDRGRQLLDRWHGAVEMLAVLARDMVAWQADVTADVNEIKTLGPLPDDIALDQTDRWSRAMRAGLGVHDPDVVVDGCGWHARPFDIAATLALAAVAAAYDAGLPGSTISPIRDGCGITTHTIRSAPAIATRTPLARRVARATPAPSAEGPQS